MSGPLLANIPFPLIARALLLIMSFKLLETFLSGAYMLG